MPPLTPMVIAVLTLNVFALDYLKVNAFLSIQTELMQSLRELADPMAKPITLLNLEKLVDHALQIYDAAPSDHRDPQILARMTGHLLSALYTGNRLQYKPVLGRLGVYDHLAVFELFHLGEFRLTNLLRMFADETWVGISASGRDEIYQLHVYPEWVDMAYHPYVYAIVKSKWETFTGVVIDMQTHPVTL